MPLSGPINDAHPAASDFFQNLIFAQVPIRVGSVNFTQQVIERLLGLRAIAVGANTRREKTVQTKTATNSRCRSTLWADARFILEGDGNGTAVRTHARGEDSRSSSKRCKAKIKSSSNIYLSGLASIVCVKTAKKHAVWFQYSYPKIPEVKFLRNFRNLTTEDTARLLPQSARCIGEKSSQAATRLVYCMRYCPGRRETPIFPPQAISRHLPLRRDSAIRHRSHWLPRQFERLLRGAECDNDHAFDAQEASLPSREA